MTLDEAVARIQRGLSFRTDKRDEIVQSLEEARIDLEMGKTLPWFLLVEDAPLPLLAGTDVIALPTGFIRQARFERLRYTSSDSDAPLFIPWKTLDEASLAYSGRDPSGPKVAVLRANSIKIFPVADLDYSLLWSYYAHSTSLDGEDADDNAWLANCPDALIGLAGERIADDLEDEIAVAKFQKISARGKAQYLFEEVERDQAGGPYQMGSNN